MKAILTSFLAVFILFGFHSNGQNSNVQGFTTSANLAYASAGSSSAKAVNVSSMMSPSPGLENEVTKTEESKSVENSSVSVVSITKEELYENKTLNLLWNDTAEISKMANKSGNYYAIEKSTDKSNFNQVGVVVESEKSATAHQYLFADTNLVEDISYYQLQNLDEDKPAEVSDIKWVRIFGSNDILVYPNEMNGDLNMNLKHEFYKITIAGMDNRSYAPSIYFCSNGMAVMDASLLPVGFYYITVSNKNSIIKIQFFKRK